MKQRLILLFVVIAWPVLGWSRDIQPKDFVIDQSKPYVYLKFDHVGPRKPIGEGEGKVGLWLRVVNNCRIPILFVSHDMPSGSPGVMLDDEVVEVEPTLQIFGSTAEVDEYERQEKLRRSNLHHKPNGYQSEVAGVARIVPGEELLFSVPRNHVNKDWYMRVKFALDLNPSSIGVGPFTYLTFYESDIPK